MTRFNSLAVAIVGFVMLASSPVFALSFNFADIPPDNGINISSSFSGEMIELNGQVLFTISNNVSAPSSIFIGQVFFDYDPNDLLTLVGFNAAHSIGDVNFTPKSNGTFPQGNNLDPKFVFDVQEVADKGGSNKQGIDDGEVGAFLFAFGNGYTYGQIEDALRNGKLRVGIHVQGIPFGEGSDSYVSTVPQVNQVNQVPEPSTVLLLGLGVLGIATLKRKMK